MTAAKRTRLFLDSNVITGGIVAAWGLDKAILSLCAARVCRLVLAEAVQDEVERNLLVHLAKLTPDASARVSANYDRLIALTKPEIVPYPSATEVASKRHLIRHAADVPVLLSAMASRPDWLLTHNTKHFSAAVAHRTGLRIGTPLEFFRALAQTLT